MNQTNELGIHMRIWALVHKNVKKERIFLTFWLQISGSCVQAIVLIIAEFC